MNFGVACFFSDTAPPPLDLAQASEQAGFESIFLPDHTHIPVARETPYPMPPYGALPPAYARLPDPLILLASLAAVTTTLKLATGICLIVERDPILFAKQTATLDVVSGGRLILGVGAGWNLEEMRNHGTDPATRTKLMIERIEAVKQIWTRDEAAYHGDLVDFDPIYSWPKPLQKPHPPILIGGNGPTVLDRVLRCGDGWYPGHQKDLGGLRERIEELHTRCRAAGKPPLPVTLQGARPDQIDEYAAIGIERCVFSLPYGPLEAVWKAFAIFSERVKTFG